MGSMDSDIAVVGVTISKRGECLFLKRNNLPKNWCPPSGKLRYGEDPKEGVQREIFEETGLQASVLMAVDTWTGYHRDKEILSISYVCEVVSKNVILSNEHSDFTWIPLKDLPQMTIETDFDTKNFLLFVELAREFQKRKI